MRSESVKVEVTDRPISTLEKLVNERDSMVTALTEWRRILSLIPADSRYDGMRSDYQDEIDYLKRTLGWRNYLLSRLGK